MELRNFTENDWNYLAGAEPFLDGSLPMVGETYLEKGFLYGDVTILLDRTGLNLIWVEFIGAGLSGDEDTHQWLLSGVSKEDGIEVARQLEVLPAVIFHRMNWTKIM